MLGLLVVCYVIAGAIQLALMVYWTGGASVPRLGVQKMPFLLFLAPVAPALSLELLMQKFSLAGLIDFLAFLVPFLVCATFTMRMVFRKSALRGREPEGPMP